MSYLAALWSDGRVVTGVNHGDAFGKLTLDEQDGHLISGFWNPETGQFLVTEDDSTFYVKNIVLVRHSKIDEKMADPCLSEEGRCLAASTAARLSTGIRAFKGYHSPVMRCAQTARIFEGRMDFEFEGTDALHDIMFDETQSAFLLRLKKFVDDLPDNSVVITHSNCIIHLAQLLTGYSDLHEIQPDWDGRIPECSVTFVHQRQLNFIGSIIA